MLAVPERRVSASFRPANPGTIFPRGNQCTIERRAMWYTVTHELTHAPGTPRGLCRFVAHTPWWSGLRAAHLTAARHAADRRRHAGRGTSARPVAPQPRLVRLSLLPADARVRRQRVRPDIGQAGRLHHADD